jgi:hypothetical protein
VTSLLLPSSATLLAYKRLVDAVEALQRKIVSDVFDVGFFAGAENVRINPTERRVLGLARAAQAMFEAGPKADLLDAPHALQVGQGLSRFAILGSAGFELAGYADVFAPGGAWVPNAIRRGTPDPNLSRVVVGTTQLAVRAGELGRAETTDAQERARIQAFSMGLLSSVAYGVTASPVLRGLQAKRTKREWSRHSPPGDVTAAEARVLRELLGGTGAAARWQSWWPATSDVPDALFTGFVKALEEAYGLTANRPRGFADFEDGFDAGDPLSAVRLRNGYSILRQDAASSAWSWPAWYFVLSPLLVMPSIGLIIARELPHAGAFFHADASLDEASFFELLTLGIGLGALPTAGYSIFLWTQIPEHTGTFVTALLLFIARAALVVGGLAAGDASPLVRWLALFLPLVGTDVYAAIRAVVANANDRPGDAFVYFLNTFPALTAIQLLLFAGLMKLVGVDSDLAFWLLWALFTLLLLLALGLPLSWALSRSGGYASFFMRDRPDGFPLLGTLADAGTPDDVSALALLFDESGLWHDPNVPAPTLADLRYPSGPRALIRVWWEGDGDLTIAHDDHKVSLKHGSDAAVDVLLPPGKLKAADIAGRVQGALAGVKAEVVGPDDPAYDLPFPHTISDPGDPLPTLDDHEKHKGDFVAVGKSKGDAYLLRHTPRVELVTSFGDLGSTRSPLDAIGLVPAASLADLEESALGLAADLAVLLSLGAAPSLFDGPLTAEFLAGAPLPGPLTPVYQVFRQWNLDERRVNEWRMLVSGGAESEKARHAADRDPAMRPDPAGAPYASQAPGGESLANMMGWIPVWRAWLRMASDLTSDTNAANAMPYTPSVATRDGHTFQPTNAQLTDAVRFLLDLP